MNIETIGFWQILCLIEAFMILILGWIGNWEISKLRDAVHAVGETNGN